MKTMYVDEITTDNKPEYRITKLVNSVDYSIGAVLKHGVIADYCVRTDWRVIITTGV